MRLVGRLLEFTWFCALGAALVISALTTDRRAREVEENPSFCDPFGYLQMAQNISQAAAAGKAPRFTLESPHTRLLIDLMKKQEVPLPVWDEMVAPLAYHYFPAADHVGVQYLPGAGLLLALFPEGRALHGLNRLVIAIFLVAGLIMLVAAAVKRLPVSAGFFSLALILGLEILARIDNASFSINALLAPLLLSALCLSGAWAVQSKNPSDLRWPWLLTFLAGLLFGFAMLARLPVILLLPGVLLLLWPANLRSVLKSAWLPFALGVILTGLIPMMVHQSRVAGAWYLPTYGHENTEAHSLARVGPNLSYYLTGKASTEHWVLPVIFLGCLGLFFWSSRPPSTEWPATFLRRLSWSRLVAAALLMLGSSTAFFLTHFATASYYLVPATFGTVLMLALGSFALERHDLASIRGRGWFRTALPLTAIALSLAPGLIVMGRVWSNYVPASVEFQPKQFSLPAELADESAWVWACSLSGTLWYYARKPAHKLSSTNADTRELVYRFVRQRGEPQYIVTDDEGMQAVAKEIVELGATLERRGEVDGYPYFLIHWPAYGSR
ncbi:MAG: hypothetical protein JWM21_1295 [Acidobacteria bacterium]|nr:hypothetical protein [Acidobacteriota bacterium]